jgi:signal transduction histidine kinase
MARSEPIDLVRQETPKAPELHIGAVAQELLLPLQHVRQGVALVGRETPRASELIQKIDETLQAMERVVDELLELSRVRPGLTFPRHDETSGVVLRRSRSSRSGGSPRGPYVAAPADTSKRHPR